MDVDGDGDEYEDSMDVDGDEFEDFMDVEEEGYRDIGINKEGKTETGMEE